MYLIITRNFDELRNAGGRDFRFVYLGCGYCWLIDYVLFSKTGICTAKVYTAGINAFHIIQVAIMNVRLYNIDDTS